MTGIPNPPSATDEARGAYFRLLTSPRFASGMLLGIVLWEFAVLYLSAGRKPFWYDELVTLHVSSLQPFSRFWSALQAGADAMPPGYYAVVRLARMLPVDPLAALRLPSILGYILTLLGVYWFAGKRLPALAGLTAVLLISLSPFRAYAIEARSYALLVGWLAISAAVWQRIGERRFLTPLLGVVLMLAVSSHSLAVVALSCFGMAELYRTMVTREFRWGVWTACVLASSPFFMGLPLLLHFRAVFGTHYWARPAWNSAVSTYGTYFGLDAGLALVLIAFFLLVVGESLRRIWRSTREEAPESAFIAAELVLIGCFLLYPALLVVLTKVLGSGYTTRYGWPGLLGLVLGAAYLFRVFRFPVAHLVTALLIACAVQAGQDVRTLAKAGPGLDEPWVKLAQLGRAEPGVPVVIGGSHAYLEAVQYAPSELRERLVQVVDADAALRWGGTDTDSNAARLLARFFPLHVEPLGQFEAGNTRFLLYSGGWNDWFTQYLVEKGRRLTLLAREGDNLIFVAER